MRTRCLSLLALLALLVLAAPAAAAEYVPGEVIVKYREGGSAQQLQIDEGETVTQTVEELSADPEVKYAVPNLVAHAASFMPNDPGVNLQWNLFEQYGVGMPEAWTLAESTGAPGASPNRRKRQMLRAIRTSVKTRRLRRFGHNSTSRAPLSIEPRTIVAK